MGRIYFAGQIRHVRRAHTRDNHHGDIVDWHGFDEQKNAENNARYIAAFNPEVVQALLDEREAQSKRIAELEANFTELAAENAAMKLFIRGSCYVFDGEQDEISDAYICATDGGMPQTPATDAFLAEVRAQGVEMLAKIIRVSSMHLREILYFLMMNTDMQLLFPQLYISPQSFAKEAASEQN